MGDSRQELFLRVLDEVAGGSSAEASGRLEGCRSDAVLRASQVGSRHLINTLNYLSFSDRMVSVNFKHPRYPKGFLSLKAVPTSCHENRLECAWRDRRLVPEKLRDYEFMHVYINDGRGLIVLRSAVQHIDTRSILMDLTEFQCCEIRCRGHRRFEALGIEAELLQSGLVFPGHLVDFSASSFRVLLKADHGSFKYINRQATGVVLLRAGDQVIFSGDCRLLREAAGKTEGEFVFEPVQTSIRRFPARSQRSARTRLRPSPQAVFEHPITGTTVTLKVDDIAGSGFSVEEADDRSLLLPGLMLPDVALNFASGFTVRCKVQIVYRRCEVNERGENIAHCGAAFISMNSKDQAVLSSILHRAANDQVYVCSAVDLDALWKFFFESGFVYPEKFVAISQQKERFKETYRKLYQESPEIAKHFIYQERGEILGHIAMLRFYEDTWICHHHAGQGRFGIRAGLVVLSHLVRYVYDFYNLPEARMDYLLSYFQPDKRFPMRIFGDFVRHAADPKACSMEGIAVYTVRRSFEHCKQSGEYMLDQATAADLSEIETFYEETSGGLMLSALDLTPDAMAEPEVSQVYQRLGLLRMRRLFCLRRRGELKALFMVCVSNAGLNMSNLTNCIHAFVPDPAGLPVEQFFSAVSSMTSYFPQDAVSLLLYPQHCGDRWGLQPDRLYNLWVIGIQCYDQFSAYMHELQVRRGSGGALWQRGGRTNEAL